MSSLALKATCRASMATFWKILLFLSFQMFHIVYIATPLKCCRRCLGTVAATCSHHVLISVGWVWGRIRLVSKCSHANTRVQTSLARGHSRHRWRPDSNGPLHNTQWSLLTILLARLSLLSATTSFWDLQFAQCFSVFWAARLKLCSCYLYGVQQKKISRTRRRTAHHFIRRKECT